jgi:hypothetical protein
MSRDSLFQVGSVDHSESRTAPFGFAIVPKERQPEGPSSLGASGRRAVDGLPNNSAGAD